MKNGFTIEPVNTWSGKRWAVVDANRNIVTLKDRVASFSFDSNGLEKAREIMAEFRKNAFQA